VTTGRVLLTDGTPALVRPLGPDDAADLLALHETLPERDRYQRFSTLHPVDVSVVAGLVPAGALVVFRALRRVTA
jgi:hypothetical protein